MCEFRIYFECLEQANDYIKPIINEVIKGFDIKINLVKRPKKTEQLPEGSIYALYSLTTPDILITGVSQNIEYPLALIEFTEAVQTEDHELQRSYGALAAYLAQMFYIKISGEKKSDKEFGGAEYNPYSTPKILIDTFSYEGFIIADWQTNGGYNLQRSENLFGCPPDISILKDVLQSITKTFLQNSYNWFKNTLVMLKARQSYQSFRRKVDNAAGSQELLKEWQSREVRNRNLNKLRYFVRKNWIGAKINRFSHAMDPDRGILTFISFIFSQTHKVYGVYALVRPRNDDLKDDITNLAALKNHLNKALENDKNGIPRWFAAELKEIVQTATSQTQEIDFQPIWEKYKDKISENKVILTMAYMVDGIYLNHNGIRLYWDRYKLLGNPNENFLSLFKTFFGFTNFTLPVPIEYIQNEVDEDEVTYTLIHKVFIPNKFHIISISYPGSQGGCAILPDPQKGKSQPREYPDIIALPPFKNPEIDVLLNESKGMFSLSSIQKDTEKILRYKTSANLQAALKETLVMAEVFDKNDRIHKILIGIAFGLKSDTPTTWKPDQVDFIFRIVNRKKWSIGIFNQALRDLIPKIEGDTNFPVIYKIVSKKTAKKQTKIFESY